MEAAKKPTPIAIITKSSIDLPQQVSCNPGNFRSALFYKRRAGPL
jgi:hypothetical protein